MSRRQRLAGSGHELFDLLLEQMIAAGQGAPEQVHGMAEAMRNRLFELEALAEEPPERSAIN